MREGKESNQRIANGKVQNFLVKDQAEEPGDLCRSSRTSKKRTVTMGAAAIHRSPPPPSHHHGYAGRCSIADSGGGADGGAIGTAGD